MAGLLLAVPTAALLLGNTAPLERIVFFGDSLVHRSNAEHALLERVRQGLVGHARRRRFELVDAGRNGDRIADLRKRLREDVLPLHPSAVVLYWDSDVSDVSELRRKIHPPGGVTHTGTAPSPIASQSIARPSRLWPRQRYETPSLAAASATRSWCRSSE